MNQPGTSASLSSDEVENSLGQTIKLLGDLLGQTIVHQAGADVLDLEEKIRSLAKARRSGDNSAVTELPGVVSSMVNDIEMTDANLKAFSTYFQLVNLAEEHERVRVLQQRADKAWQAGVPMDETILDALVSMRDRGIDADAMQAMLGSMLVMPVFTAHPTESRRQTTRQILKSVSELLSELSSRDLTGQQREQVKETLMDYIVLLWQSAETRDRPPTVMDEVRSTGLYFVENTLFDLVPRIYEQLEEDLKKVYPDYQFDVPTMMRYGSWIGGDRDGNPYVTNEVTIEALTAQKQQALKLYCESVLELYHLLSCSRDRVGFSDAFMASMEHDRTLVPEHEREQMARFVPEPYREKLVMMYRRLVATSRVTAQSLGGEPRNTETGELITGEIPATTYKRAYPDASAFLADIQLIRESLIANKGERLVRGRLNRLMRAVEVFGFHLASLDVRQHARIHREAISDLMKQTEGIDDYASLGESQMVDVLTRQLQSDQPLKVEGTSDSTGDLVGLFQLIAKAQQSMGPVAMETYIISMTENVSNLLEVMLLADHAGLSGRIDIVPLFETVDDLLAASETMKALFANPVYAKHLAARGNQQQIMIGYSDSNKDGGYVRANWMLFTAQRQLARTCLDHDITLTLFHGRGGSLGRGGGPTNRAILAQPQESVRGRIRITEQGEVVSSRYSHPGIARRHLEQLLHAVMSSTARGEDQDATPSQWSGAMDSLSLFAFEKYRSLVQHPLFLEYFQTATPMDQIGQLNIGSRPTHRRATKSLDDLRAIPWVFAWTQSRANLPSWYGIGSGFEKWLNKDDSANGEDSRESRMDLLKTMYREWAFFRTMLDNVHLGMGRADMTIAGLYADLARPETAEAIFSDIHKEFDLSKSILLEVTGAEKILDTEPWLQHSIRVRNPYVDPLNYIQVELMKKLRANPDGPDAEHIRQGILQSINGIAAGLQNVG